MTLSLDLPPTVTEFRVPAGVIALGTQFKYEVIARRPATTPRWRVVSEFSSGAELRRRALPLRMVSPNDSTDVRVRDAQPEDHAFVLDLVPELLAFGPPPWRNGREMMAVDHQVIGAALEGRPEGATVLIAEEASGKRLGFIHLSEEDDYYGGVCGHVGDVIVSADARGRGVGSALLTAGEQWARARGYRLLTLNVFLANDKARALYERVGFQPETVRFVKDLR